MYFKYKKRVQFCQSDKDMEGLGEPFQNDKN